MNEKIELALENLRELIIEQVGQKVSKVYIIMEDGKIEVDYEFRHNHRNIK